MIGMTQHLMNESDRMAAGARRLAFASGMDPIALESIVRKAARAAHRIALERVGAAAANDDDGGTG